MSKSKTWRDVAKGDVVEMIGKPFTVTKIKPKGKAAKVSVTRGDGRNYTSVVKLKDPVRIVKPPKIQDAAGTQQRWATKRELDDVMGKPKLPAGDARQSKPPKKPEGGVWDRPIDRVESRLEDLLSARLVGESHDESAGYYVPPIDVSTIAAHLLLFHGGVPEGCEDEGAMILAHNAQHAAAKSGEGVLAVQHWHTSKRP